MSNPIRPLRTLLTYTSHRRLKTVAEADIPKPTVEESKAVVLADDEDLEQDLALFRDSAKLPAPPVDDGYRPLPDSVLASSTSGSLLPSSSIIDESSACQIRHLTIAPSFRKTSQVDSYILDMAVHAALGTASSSPTRFSQAVLVLDPKLDKNLRAQALNRGFRIAGRAPLEKLMQDQNRQRGGAIAGLAESVLRVIWPISFEQEVLLLHRKDWERQKSKR